MNQTQELVRAYWKALDDRDWDAFRALLADDVVYEVPQTRERIRGRDAYVRFNREYPGQWRVEIERALGDGRHGATWVRFAVDGEVVDGLTHFELSDDGLVAKVTDFWPEPYEPPAGREHLTERW